MSRHFGVKCKTCGIPIIIGDLEEFAEDKFPVYAVPLEPIACKVCGNSDMYDGKDRIEFELGEGPMRA